MYEMYEMPGWLKWLKWLKRLVGLVKMVEMVETVEILLEISEILETSWWFFSHLKNMRKSSVKQNGIIFCKDRGENKKPLKPPY